MRFLTCYRNCSLGGMSSVFRGRAMQNPHDIFDFFFSEEKGGVKAYTELRNVNLRIVREDRLISMINFCGTKFSYDTITVCSMPNIINGLNINKNTKVVYEIHSPIRSIIKRELQSLDLEKVHEIWTPSSWSAEEIKFLLGKQTHPQIVVKKNITDNKHFNIISKNAFSFSKREGQIPILWIGRAENTHKNYIDMFRVLSLLPQKFYAILILSLENDPSRIARLLGQAALYHVEQRIDIFNNVPQEQMGLVHRGVRNAGGVFCSTSFAESFGYAVVEASMCGLPVVAYNVGALCEHSLQKYFLIDVGDIKAMAAQILNITNKEQ